MNPALAKTKSRRSPRQLLFYILWCSLLLATLVPVKSIIYWYEGLQQARGTQITGPINASASEIIPLIKQNISGFSLQLVAIASRALFKWLVAVGIFWLFLSQLTLLHRFYKWCEGLVNKIRTVSRRNLLIIALLATLLITCLLSYQIHWFFPDYPDNVVQLYQAKLFKAGKLYIAPPKNGREFFWYPLIIKKADRWYPRYEPGHPFLLMLGLFISMPWLVNPILGGLSIIMLYKLGLEVYGEDTARLGLILLLLSPFFLTISSGFLNNASAMLFSLLGIYYFIKTVKYPFLLYPLLSGLFLGVTANIRPFTSVLIALPLGIYLLYLFLSQPRSFAPKIMSICAGLAGTISILLYYNYLTNGHPLLFGQTAMIGKLTTLGFGKSLYGITHTPFRAGVRLLDKLNQLNFTLFGWPIPSLAFIFLFFLPRFRKNRWDYLFLAIILCMLSGYYFFFALKVRYLYALTPLLVLLTARGLISLFQLLRKFGLEEKGVKSGAYVLIPIFIGYMVYTSIIPQLTPGGKHKHRLYRLVKQKEIHNAIVFLPPGFGGWGIYGQGFVHNDPEFNGDVVYAWYRGKDNIKLMQQYPKRRYYFFDPRPKDGYQFSEIKPSDYLSVDQSSKQPPAQNKTLENKLQ